MSQFKAAISNICLNITESYTPHTTVEYFEYIEVVGVLRSYPGDPGGPDSEDQSDYEIKVKEKQANNGRTTKFFF